jgi:hypothetical protein
MRYELETQHYLWDQLLEPGTIIGDDTEYPLPDGFAPSASMKPLDDAAQELSNKTGKEKQNWGRPEENLEIKPNTVSNVGRFEGGSTINRNNQPVIPPPLEHLTRPNTMRPNEGLSERTNPLVMEALEKQNAENDKRMAEEANRQSAERAANSPNKPFGVTESAGPGQGPRPTAQQNLPGQGPSTKSANQAPGARPPGQAPKPPAPASKEVPRNTGGVVPESSDGQPVKKEDEKKDEDK